MARVGADRGASMTLLPDTTVTVGSEGAIAIRSDGAVIRILTAAEARHFATLLVNAADETERGKITERTRAWYHGCWSNAGHYLHHVGGRSVLRDNECPVNEMRWLDAGWAPRRVGRDIFFVMQHPDDQRRRMHDRGEECAQGEFLLHRLPDRGVSMLAWWDRTHGDARGGCNSVYVVDGEPSVNDMLAWWPRHFPLQAKHLADAGVRLVQVHARPAPTAIPGAGVPQSR